ncbi:hypothetical protein NEDG_01327 [Nematocida displodere]|uniref:Exoribonuclease phosphorolytic domain-containing protein n=1 Tax=Nematocida displodere TaxID=1805483 RepID=A0A177EBC9_9MICR|nr:hypothetical protein NEDG_01327 [Nematocida displodere]
MRDNYFECAYSACGKRQGGIITQYEDCKVLSLLDGPYEPAKILDKFRGTVQVQIYGPVSAKVECMLAQEYIESAVRSTIRLREYPRAVFYLKIYLLEEGGSFLAACLNSVSALLMSSGVLTAGVMLSVRDTTEAGDHTAAYLSRSGVLEEIMAVGGREEKAELENKARDLLERMKYSVKSSYYEECLGGRSR